MPKEGTNEGGYSPIQQRSGKNAFRFGVFSLAQGDEVRIFLLGKGKEQMDLFLENGGKLIACGVCLEVRNSKEDATCPVGSMNDLYELTSWADRILTF